MKQKQNHVLTFVGVSIHLGHSDKNTIDCGLKNKHLFLTVLEAGKSKIKVLADTAFGEGLKASWFADGCLVAVSSHGGGGDWGSTLVSFSSYKDINSIMGVPFS